MHKKATHSQPYTAWGVTQLLAHKFTVKAQIPLGSSRLDTRRHVRRVERVETSVSIRAVRQARHSQNAWVRHVERVVSRRVATIQVECGLNLVS